MISTTWVITDGYPTTEVIQRYANKGYRLLATREADEFHPYALHGDKITFFATKCKASRIVLKEENE